MLRSPEKRSARSSSREAADYDAASVAHDEAAATAEQAERFVEAVRRLFEP